MSETPESVRSRDPLIEAAVRPLSDNAELHLAAAGFLENLKISDDGAEVAIARWDARNARKRRSFWPIALWAALIVVSAAVWILGTRELIVYSEWAVWARSPFSNVFPDPTDRIADRLDEHQKMLLFGDLNEEFPEDRKEALWRSEPENPAYFAEYAVTCFRETGELPPDFLKTARRIDPDNAWFTYYAAAAEAKGCVERKPAGVDAATTWEVLDQARMDRALALFHAARDQPKFDDYRNELLRERLRLLSQESLSEHLDSMACIANVSVNSHIEAITLVNAVGAKACAFGEAGDVGGFSDLSADTDAYLHQLYSGEPGTLLQELVTSAMLSLSAANLAPAAEKLGLEGEAAKWRNILDRLQEVREIVKSRGFLVDGKTADAGKISGTLFGNSYKMMNARIESLRLLTGEDLKPGRMVDHEILSRFFGHVTWGLIGLCLALTALYRFRVAALLLRLAHRVEELLRPLDWAWIIGGGVMLPFLFVMGVNRLTPLGGREFGMVGNAGLLPLAHFLGLLVLWLIVPVQIARWRLAGQVGFFRYTYPSWIAWSAMLAAFAFVPMIGWAVISGSPGEFWVKWVGKLPMEIENSEKSTAIFWWALGMLALPVLWLTGSAFRSVFTRHEWQLQRVTVSMILVRSFAVAMLLMISVVPVFKAAEQYWFNRETLMKFDPEQPSWSRYEYQLAAQMRNEMRKILGKTP